MNIFRSQSPSTIRGEISPFTAADAPYTQDLILSYSRQHLHLDWQSVPDMLNDPAFIGVTIRDHQVPHTILGAIVHHSVNQDEKPIAWIRVALPYHQSRADPGLQQLWTSLRQELQCRNVVRVALLVFDPWLEQLAQSWEFSKANSVITMRRSSHELPELKASTMVHIRNTEWRDIEAIAALDANAFEPLWRLSRNALTDAHRQAATFTVAEIDHQIAGYQLSTWHFESGHLARLAVTPELQGKRIGQSLAIQMLHFFAERQVHTITVNTQIDNTSSQKLYQRLGFQPTHHIVPVWECLLES